MRNHNRLPSFESIASAVRFLAFILDSAVVPCARGGPGGAPPRRVAILLSLLGGWHDNRYPMHLWRRCGVFARRRAGRVVCCARSGAIRITLLFRLATLARLHGSSISICSRPSALRPPVPSLSTVECTHSGVPVRSMSLVHHYTQPSQAAHTQNTQPHFTQTTHTKPCIAVHADTSM